MRKILSFASLLVVAAAALGCGSDDSSSNSGPAADAGLDQSSQSDGSNVDADASHQDVAEDVQTADSCCDPDTGSDATQDVIPVDACRDTELPDAPADHAADAPGDVKTDSEADAKTDVQVNRPAGQCKKSVDCPSGLTCNQAPPGGLCQGCGTDSDCQDSNKYTCKHGTCVRKCMKESDCPAGLRCGTTGYCLMIPCTQGCPAPYTCPQGGKFCYRQECGNGKPPCPSGTTCQDGYCMEN